MWAFMGLHPTNIELLQRLKKADDPRFGVNMDVAGTVAERNLSDNSWQQTHMVGIRSDIWNPDTEFQENILQRIQSERTEELQRTARTSGTHSVARKKELQTLLDHDPILMLEPGDIECRRLVLKLFATTGQRIRWTGSIEEVVSREVHNSLGASRTMLSFSASLDRYEYLTVVQENNRTFRYPSLFSCCFYDQRDDRMFYLQIKRRWISIGADYNIIGPTGKVGEIDGALIGFGYNAHIYLYDEQLSSNRYFLDLMTLFASTVGYQAVLRQSVRRRIQAVRSGQSVQSVIEDEEYQLLRNPRSRTA